MALIGGIIGEKVIISNCLAWNGQQQQPLTSSRVHGTYDCSSVAVGDDYDAADVDDDETKSRSIVK